MKQNEEHCLYCRKPQVTSPYFLRALGNKDYVSVCGSCSSLPFDKRPNWKEADEERRRIFRE